MGWELVVGLGLVVALVVLGHERQGLVLVVALLLRVLVAARRELQVVRVVWWWDLIS